MLVAGCDDHDAAPHDPLSKLHVLKMVGRRSLPSLIEATIIPSILFYVFLVTVGPAAAMLAALTWAYGSVLRRFVSRQRIPGVLQLAVAGLTIRTMVGSDERHVHVLPAAGRDHARAVARVPRLAVVGPADDRPHGVRLLPARLRHQRPPRRS